MRKMSKSGQNICVSKYNNKCLKKNLFLDPYFQYCKYSHTSKHFAYLYIVGSHSIFKQENRYKRNST